MSGSADYLFGRSLSTEDTAAYIAENLFDPQALFWSENAKGERVIAIPEEQWALVRELELNMFFDDGEGFIDLGRDNRYYWDEDGNLLAPQEMIWPTINGQFVAYYHEYTTGSGASRVDTGYVPVLLNGERAELLISFDAEGYGSVVGARLVYPDGRSDAVAKSYADPGETVDLKRAESYAEDTGEICALRDGDEIDFLCDYYGYDGSYLDSYKLGEAPMVVNGELKVYDAYLPSGGVLMTYRFTDLYQQNYWTLPIEG